jgi:hypothetical protein
MNEPAHDGQPFPCHRHEKGKEHPRVFLGKRRPPSRSEWERVATRQRPFLCCSSSPRQPFLPASAPSPAISRPADPHLIGLPRLTSNSTSSCGAVSAPFHEYTSIPRSYPCLLLLALMSYTALFAQNTKAIRSSWWCQALHTQQRSEEKDSLLKLRRRYDSKFSPRPMVRTPLDRRWQLET